MGLIIRLDVDRSYGKSNLPKHLMSIFSQNLYFPKISKFGYLEDLQKLLYLLKDYDVKAYLYFRKCTLPKRDLINQILTDGHIIGLHLERSKNKESFSKEVREFEKYFNSPLHTFTKHGSGKKNMV